LRNAIVRPEYSFQSIGNYKYRKIGMMPSKADPDVQDKLKKTRTIL